MSFYHVLASNVSPEVFPNNHASMFSTPLEHPYDMKGKYEVSLMNMTYAGCVNTFNKDVLTIAVPYTIERLKETNVPVRFNLDRDMTIDGFVKEVNDTFKSVVQFQYVQAEQVSQSKVLMWTFYSNFCIVFSNGLKDVLQCSSRVITPWDLIPTTSQALDPHTRVGDNASFIFVPLIGKSTIIPIKSANELTSIEETIERFNSRVDVAHIENNKSQKIESTAAMDNDHVLILSPALLYSLMYPYAGMCKNDSQSYLSSMYFNTRDFKDESYVMVLYLEDIQNWNDKMTKNISLPPHSFKQASDVIPYLKEHVNDAAFSFSCNRNNYLMLQIHHKDSSIRFSDTLRDIFAFDKNEYRGIGKYRGTDVISLTRRIQYLYVYANISDYVRVGNTEAPLLAVIPFEASNTCDNLVEKNFPVPMYVHVSRDYISQIDIYIYDGSGKLVPFVEQAITCLRLHYRQL